jgi:hypothetical protein
MNFPRQQRGDSTIVHLQVIRRGNPFSGNLYKEKEQEKEFSDVCFII